MLVLDNFEQVLPAAAIVAELLTSEPGVKALVTSRSLLRVSGEHCFPVPPLSLPEFGQGHGSTLPSQLAEIERAEAVRLFVTRAQAVDPGFHLTGANAPVVADICGRLDGLPLAIELAAARANVLTPTDLLARLGRRLPLLTDGPADQPERLRTLRGAIRWSYELLSAEEQRVFEQLAVCADGFSVQAAEHIAGTCPREVEENQYRSASDDEHQVRSNEPPSSLALLTSLVDKNLLRRNERSGGARFAMLETIREFGLERLHERGGATDARDSHAAYYLDFAERSAPDHFRDHDLQPRLDAVEAEYDNVRVALAHLLHSDGAAAIRLAGLLPSYWHLRSRVGEGRDWLERAIAGGGSAPSRTQATALTGLGLMSIFLQDLTAAKEALAQAVALAKAADDVAGLGFARVGQAILAIHERDFAVATCLGAECAHLYASIGDDGHALQGRFAEAHAAQYSGDLERAETLYRQLLSYEPALPYPQAIVEQSLALIANVRGDHQQALAHAVGALRSPARVRGAVRFQFVSRHGGCGAMLARPTGSRRAPLCCSGDRAGGRRNADASRRPSLVRTGRRGGEGDAGGEGVHRWMGSRACPVADRGPPRGAGRRRGRDHDAGRRRGTPAHRCAGDTGSRLADDARGGGPTARCGGLGRQGDRRRSRHLPPHRL